MPGNVFQFSCIYGHNLERLGPSPDTPVVFNLLGSTVLISQLRLINYLFRLIELLETFRFIFEKLILMGGMSL